MNREYRLKISPGDTIVVVAEEDEIEDDELEDDEDEVEEDEIDDEDEEDEEPQILDINELIAKVPKDVLSELLDKKDMD